ncbi:MAG TPA: PA14 domain-containing protein [Kofleriaceae bacterium]|nr:PA14 domain-containing protein [Kofleriaceae bacterium]
MGPQLESLAAARALIDEPAVSLRCALPHLIAAWCAAAECEAGELVERLHGGAVSAIPAARRTGVIAVVTRAVEATRAEPWAEAALPSRRALRRCLSALEDAIADRPRRRWPVIAAITGGLALLLGMHCAAQRGVDRGGSWRAAYYANPGFAGPAVQRVVDSPSAEPPVAGPYSARYMTCLELDGPAEATFQLVVTGGASLYVDGRALIDAWAGGDGARTRGGRIALAAGRYTLRLDSYGPDTDSGVAVLASFDGTAPAPLRAVAPCRESAP